MLFQYTCSVQSKVMRVERDTLLRPFHSKYFTKLAILHDFKNHLMLCSLFKNRQKFDLRVPKSDAFDPHGFSAKRVCLLEKDLWSDSPFS